MQCYRLCRTAYTSEYFPESDELDNCIAQTSEASVATCIDDGIKFIFLFVIHCQFQD